MIRLAGSVFLFFLASNIVASSLDVQTFKHSWVANALNLQRQIDLNAPLNQATFIGTHNSYNAKSYTIPFVSYVDPNQELSIYDQLEMGVRSVEFDAHWYTGAHFKKEILLCHGQDNHLGCGNFDRPFTKGLEELRNWLNDNPGEIVLLYIERHLDGHEPRLTAELEQYVGKFIFKPTEIGDRADSCVSLPSVLTKAKILKAGKQLIIVAKHCDGKHTNYQETNQFKLNWNDYVFAGIGHINSPFDFLDSTIGKDFQPYPECGKNLIFGADPTHDSLWRIFEDRTILSNMVEKHQKLLSKDMRDIMQCGINWPTMDMLTVEDDRLKAAVWSWADSYPKEELVHQCVMYDANFGMKNVACDQVIGAFACKQDHTNDWQIVNAAGSWQDGEKQCQLLAGSDWHFAVPVNANQMYLLKNAAGKISEIWLNYAMSQNQQWIANKTFV